MNNIAQWNFQLVDAKPGPSIDDAADFIRQLGGDPWVLDSLDCIATTTFGNIVIAEYTATGPIALLEKLRSAHARATESNPPPLKMLHDGDPCLAAALE